VSSRYGRNQRREARQRIAALETELARSTGRLRGAEGRAEDARTLALNEYMEKHGMLKDAVENISFNLSRQLGPILRPHAEKIMAAHRDSVPVKFSARTVLQDHRDVTVIRGHIPALDWNVALF
jgi:hypothetical protein